MNEPKYKLLVFGSDMSAHGYPLVETLTHSFTVEMPPDSVLDSGMIAAYRAEQRKLRAEMQVKIDKLEHEIQNLLAITGPTAAQ